jgi:hypothetical protein
VRHPYLIGPNNQSVDPALVAPETGDFHESLTSPTRDRGEATAIGLDFQGEPRPIGASTDIGADESIAGPTATTLAATDITEYRFELAATPLLGLTGAVGNLPGAAGAEPVSARIEGLRPDTTYYFRAVATNSKATSTGPTLTFVTPNTDFTAPILGGLKLSNTTFALGRGSRRCPPRRAAPCCRSAARRPGRPQLRCRGLWPDGRFRMTVKDKADNRSEPAVISFRVVRR